MELILKDLQDLKPKAQGLENKIKEESSKDDNRDKREENANRGRGGEDDIIHRIKIDPPIFDSILGPKIFSDWMADLNCYFD